MANDLDELIGRAADLVALELSEDEKSVLRSDFARIIDWVAVVTEASGDEPMGTEVVPLIAADDEPRPSLDRSVTESLAPAVTDGMYVVPRVIGESS